MFYDETSAHGLPSPNMPTLSTAIVYPGTVLIEALNLSEARGTTTPFELFGAPWLNTVALKKNLDNRDIPGCAFRIHNYIPTFHKYAGQLCGGIQIHVTDRRNYFQVGPALEIFDAIIETLRPTLYFQPSPVRVRGEADALRHPRRGFLCGKCGSIEDRFTRKERWAEEHARSRRNSDLFFMLSELVVASTISRPPCVYVSSILQTSPHFGWHILRISGILR